MAKHVLESASQAVQKKRWLVARRFLKRIWKAAALWLRYDGGVQSAAVAYYAALSVLPILLLSSIATQFIATRFQFDTELHKPLLVVIQEESSLQMREAIERTIATTNDLHPIGGPLSVVWLFMMALMVFSQLDRGFRRLWAKPQSKPSHLVSNAISNAIGLLTNRTRAVMLLFGFGLVFSCIFATSFVMDLLARFIDEPWGLGRTAMWPMHAIFHVLVHTTFAGAIFKHLSPMAVSTKDALHSAFFLAIGWEIGRQILSAGIVNDYQSLYGICGSFMMIQLWIYYAAINVFFWAAYLRCLVEEREQVSGNPSSNP